MKLRIATYNVHKCKGLDGRVSVQRIAGVIGELDADVVALQEIFGAQAERLARELSLHSAFGENRQLMGDAYGNLVLSKHSLRSHCNYDVSIMGHEKEVVSARTCSCTHGRFTCSTYTSARTSLNAASRRAGSSTKPSFAAEALRTSRGARRLQ